MTAHTWTCPFMKPGSARNGGGPAGHSRKLWMILPGLSGNAGLRFRRLIRAWPTTYRFPLKLPKLCRMRSAVSVLAVASYQNGIKTGARSRLWMVLMSLRSLCVNGAGQRSRNVKRAGPTLIAIFSKQGFTLAGSSLPSSPPRTPSDQAIRHIRPGKIGSPR
jgi:hypothetical protein